MSILRILLVLGLFAGCTYIVSQAPWKAFLEPAMFHVDMGNAPLWSPPETPGLDQFDGFYEGAEVPDGAEIVVKLNRRVFFGRACVIIVGLFFAFGILGTLVERRPESSDVVFSLWLSIGMLLGIVVSVSLGHAAGTEQFPYFSECLLAGFVVGLLIALKSRTRLPLSKGKSKGDSAATTKKGDSKESN